MGALSNYCLSKLGTKYVYAAKNEIVTQAKINSWAKLYPSTFTPSYKAKAAKFIGLEATDCSGLICGYTGVMRGSANMKSNAIWSAPISKLNENHIDFVLYKPGHVGVYIGGGYCVEARGIDYGTVKTKVSSRSFTHIILLPEQRNLLSKVGSATADNTTAKWTEYNLNPHASGICTGNDVNVRSGAATNYSSYGKISRGHSFTVQAKCSNNWYKISVTVNGKAVTGYISGSYVNTSGASNTTVSNTAVGNKSISAAQTWVNTTYNTSIIVDGIEGPATRKAFIKAMQIELNKQYNTALTIDGIWGTNTSNACAKALIRRGAAGNLTRIIQYRLICKGYSVGTSGADGSFGAGTESGVISLQKSKGIAADGIVGKDTWSSLLH